MLLKPPLINVDLLNWQAFDRAIEAGYQYARATLEDLPAIPRLVSPAAAVDKPNALAIELQTRLAATLAAG